MPTRATRKGATAAKRASKAPAVKRASTPPNPATTPESPPNAVGRPTKATASTLEIAIRAYEKGMTDAEVADILGVVPATIHNWKKSQPGFLESIKAAKANFDGKVERRLAERAMGYSHESVKIFCNKDGEVTEVPYREHYPPDTGAAVFWLCNRQPDRWKQKVTHVGDPDEPVVVENRESPEQRGAIANVTKRLAALESRVPK